MLPDELNTFIACKDPPDKESALKSALPPEDPTVRNLNNYFPVVLTLILIRCFKKKGASAHKEKQPSQAGEDQPGSSPAWIQNQQNCHPVFTHLEDNNTHIRILLVDFDFSVIRLIGKLSGLGYHTLENNWMLDFLTKRPDRLCC